ncbi:hypothetical protein SLEP1_g7101 [Rubroshorea leprosula]|uniref:Uncharacterized protein n=1 Tax=Rubroshorea leprosula TaxID=152421 RepID=A0AAV5I736_9ROSI|nr:hypothetical protein SLEP1_g7101 [Rubroshorea leprosula]
MKQKNGSGADGRARRVLQDIGNLVGERVAQGRLPGPPLSEEEKKKRKEKNKKDREYRAKRTSQFKEYKEFCEEPIIDDMFKAFKEGKQVFKEVLNQLGEVWMKDGTSKNIEMLTGSSVAGMGTPFEPPTRGLKRTREEEPAEAQRAKIPATTDNYTPHHIPIGGSQPSGLMANAPKTACQSVLPGHNSRKVAQQNEGPKWINPPAQKQHDTYYVPECYTEVVISKKLDQFRSEMQERQQRMEEAIQRFFVAAPTNAPIVSPTEPHHDPHGMQGGTNAAAGYSGGPTTQSFQHNEEFQHKEYKAFCEEPGIIDMFKAFRERKKQEEFKEETKKLEEDLKKVVPLDAFDWLEHETLTGNLAGSSNVASGAMDSTTAVEGGELFFDLDAFDSWLEHGTFIGNLVGSSNVASVAMNYTPTGGEPYHDSLGMQEETTAAAGSSGGRTTQSSPDNEKF